jgi:hypothetical protein
MALTDHFLRVVKCQACRTDRILVYNDLGFYIYSRLSEPVFDSVLVSTRPHPVTAP